MTQSSVNDDHMKFKPKRRSTRLSMMELHQRKFSNFIPYDPDKKQDIDKKVQRYLDLMEDEDEDTIMNNDRLLLRNIQAKEKDFTFRKKPKE